MNNSLPLVVANLKANLSLDEIYSWLNTVSSVAENFSGTIIFCPPAPFLSAAAIKIKEQNFKIMIGAQDVSKYNEGAYTGQFAASQIKSICDYAIVGHSERRKYFSETNKDILEKLQKLIEAQIIPILCISDESQLDDYLATNNIIKENIKTIIFVNEPPSAISGGKEFHPDTPQNANKICATIKEKIGDGAITIYGGSINPLNVASFFAESNIQGGLVGQASVGADDFIKVLGNAQYK